MARVVRANITRSGQHHSSWRRRRRTPSTCACSSNWEPNRYSDIWNRTNKYGWTPLAIAEGHRPGNFKPSAETIVAITHVLSAAGIQPSAKTTAAENTDEYKVEAAKKPAL